MILRGSGAVVASGVSAGVAPSSRTDIAAAVFVLNVTAAAAAVTDTVDVYLQHSPDDADTWDDFVHFTQVLGNGGAVKSLAFVNFNVAAATGVRVATDASLAVGVRHGPVGGLWRAKWVLAGGGAAFSFSVKAGFIR